MLLCTGCTAVPLERGAVPVGLIRKSIVNWKTVQERAGPQLAVGQ